MVAMIAAIAQEESWSKSENIKWGMRHKANRGKAILNHSQFSGYTKNSAGKLVIVENEAKVVRLIYSLYLPGMGSRTIKKLLEERCIQTVCAKDVWGPSTIDRIV